MSNNKKQPDPLLINSMAMRYRHDFGLLTFEEQQSIRVTMTQLWEEVIGLGFYKPKHKTMSNNKQSMKLYTEEQVRKAIELARDTHPEGRSYVQTEEYDYSDDEVIDLLTPIELPSGIVKIEIQHQYHSSKEFYSDAGFVNCTKEQYESIKTEIPTCPLNKLIKLTPIELPSDEEIEEKLNVAYGNGYEQGEMDFYKKMQVKGDKYAEGYSEGYKRALELVN